MRTSLQRRWMVTTLFLLPLTVWGAGVPGAPDTPPQTRTVFMDSTDVQEYQKTLVQLLSSPCDSVPSASHNEIHDCQRFIIGQGTRFGPLMGIFPDTNVVNLPADAFRTPRLVAYITNAGGNEHYPDDGYEPLDIQAKSDPDGPPAQFCLWLMWVNRDDSDGWRAAITPNRDMDFEREEPGCKVAPRGDDAWVLRVKRRMKRAAEYPPSARWAWSGRGEPDPAPDGQQYIEIKCGDASCAVSDPSLNLPDDLPAGDPRRTVPEWYDAQYLAVFDSVALRGGDSILVPGPWGEVRPVMPPGPRGSMSGWHKAARIQLRGGREDWGPYADKFLLHPTGFSYLWIRTDLGSPVARYDNWITFRQVQVTKGGSLHGPHGGTRWRWHSDDERPWVPCDDFGCCEPEYF